MPTLYYPSIIASISFFCFVWALKIKRKKVFIREEKVRNRRDERTNVRWCMRVRDIAHRPLRMCRYVWLSMRERREGEIERKTRNITARIHLWISINLSSYIDTACRMDSDEDQRTHNSFQILFFSILVDERSTYYIDKYLLLFFIHQQL